MFFFVKKKFDGKTQIKIIFGWGVSHYDAVIVQRIVLSRLIV